MPESELERKVEENKIMPQFDVIFFSLLTIFIFVFVVTLFYLFIFSVFSSLFKINTYPKNIYHQIALISTIDNEIQITKSMRKS